MTVTRGGGSRPRATAEDGLKLETDSLRRRPKLEAAKLEAARLEAYDYVLEASDQTLEANDWGLDRPSSFERSVGHFKRVVGRSKP
jgi:hypothetical protein